MARIAIAELVIARPTARRRHHEAFAATARAVRDVQQFILEIAHREPEHRAQRLERDLFAQQQTAQLLSHGALRADAFGIATP